MKETVSQDFGPLVLFLIKPLYAIASISLLQIFMELTPWCEGRAQGESLASQVSGQNWLRMRSVKNTRESEFPGVAYGASFALSDTNSVVQKIGIVLGYPPLQGGEGGVVWRKARGWKSPGALSLIRFCATLYSPSLYYEPACRYKEEEETMLMSGLIEIWTL